MRRSILTCWCLAWPLFGCTDDGGNSEAAETTTGDGDGDGDPTGDGDGDGDPTGDGDGDADPGGECNSAEQCVVVNDCCTCDVVLVGEEPPCGLPECLAPTCDANGFTPEAACLQRLLPHA